MTADDFRALAASLPGVEEAPSYGTPGWRCRGKLLARLWEDGETLVLSAGFDERDLLIEVNPAVFFVTEHYRGYPRVLVRLPKADAATVFGLLLRSWREAASKKMAAAYEASPRPSSDA